MCHDECWIGSPLLVVIEFVMIKTCVCTKLYIYVTFSSWNSALVRSWIQSLNQCNNFFLVAHIQIKSVTNTVFDRRAIYIYIYIQYLPLSMILYFQVMTIYPILQYSWCKEYGTSSSSRHSMFLFTFSIFISILVFAKYMWNVIENHVYKCSNTHVCVYVIP